jgi:phosphoglycolate phosphatase
MKIFFDLDGTLIDSKHRVFAVFRHLVPESKLTFEEYWELKGNKKDHKIILTDKLFYTETEYEDFYKKWMAEIELPEWLALDKPFSGVTAYLQNQCKTNELFLLTSRQFTKRVLEQIDSFGWNRFFSAVLVTNQKVHKIELIKGLSPGCTDWIVGDTGYDIQTGKVLGIRTAAVLSGFMSRHSLLQYSPDLILNSILEFNI